MKLFLDLFSGQSYKLLLYDSVQLRSHTIGKVLVIKTIAS